MADFLGYKVEVNAHSLGTIVGVLSAYNDNQIELTDAVLNGEIVNASSYTLDKKFIINLRILSMLVNSAENTKGCSNVSTSPTSRSFRREKLRNIPGACSVYVCDRSPPRVMKTPKSQRISNRKNTEKYGCSVSMTNSGNADDRWRNRSKSACDVISGCESEPFTPHSSRKYQNQDGRCRTRRNGGTTGWDSVNIEDFIDEDFDFEANLALFDKEAFCAKSDASGASKGNNISNIAPEWHAFTDMKQVLVEGPDGVSFVPMPDQRPEDTVLPEFSTPTKEQQFPSPCATSHGVKVTRSFWCSPSGQRVPHLPYAVHDRILHFLAMGNDLDEIVPSLPFGLTWDRLIETSGLAIVNAAVNFLRQTPSRLPNSKSINQHTTRQPLRVLVLPGTCNLPGALAVNTARHLANRGGACILLYPSSLTSTSATRESSVATFGEDLTGRSSGAAYRTEMTLLRTYAPTASFFHTDDGSEEVDEDEIKDVWTPESSHGEFISQAGRMWISRIPGLKIVSKISGVICRPKNSVIDLLILGQPVDQYDADLRDWLLSHTAICLTIQFGMSHSPIKSDTLNPPASLKSWLVQLGLPVISPSSFPPSVDICLVDVGMSRSIVSRITGDLRSLPPPGLFDVNSTVHLVSKISA